VFIETAGELAPTWAGQLVYPFAHLFIVQWPEKLKAFPRAVLASGPLL
jgi:beta-1,4-N-acetylglucosaminyltransferase